MSQLLYHYWLSQNHHSPTWCLRKPYLIVSSPCKMFQILLIKLLPLNKFRKSLISDLTFSFFLIISDLFHDVTFISTLRGAIQTYSKRLQISSKVWEASPFRTQEVNPKKHKGFYLGLDTIWVRPHSFTAQGMLAF